MPAIQPPTPDPPTLPPPPQNLTQPGTNENRRSSRKKRDLREVSGNVSVNPQPETTPRQETDTPQSEKKRRVEQNTPATPPPQHNLSFNPQIPSAGTLSMSFLDENLRAYIASPSPRSNDNTPTLNNIDLSDLTGDDDAEMEDHTGEEQLPDEITLLQDRLLAAKEWENKPDFNPSKAKDPLDKYTEKPEKKLEVHYSHPTAAFDGIDLQQILVWGKSPGGKLLAHPFGQDIKDPDLQLTTKKKVFAAIAEITRSKSVGFYAPKPGVSPRTSPTVFLIYDLTEEQCRTLLDREIWSSKLITFRVTTMDPVRPNYLFSIRGLITMNEDSVKEAVKQTWTDQTTDDLLTSLQETLPERLQHQTKRIIQGITGSLHVKLLDTKEQGDTSAPSFNVYIQANLTPTDDFWRRLRNHMVAQTYALPFQEPGIASTTFFLCTICYSIDHPRGMCKFPTIKGWNGPGWRTPGPKRDISEKPRNQYTNTRRLTWSDTIMD